MTSHHLGVVLVIFYLAGILMQKKKLSESWWLMAVHEQDAMMAVSANLSRSTCSNSYTAPSEHAVLLPFPSFCAFENLSAGR